MMENLSAVSGVAYEKLEAIFPSLVAPTCTHAYDFRTDAIGARSGPLRWPIHRHFLEPDRFVELRPSIDLAG
jgi:hypothetical protein